MKKPELKEQSYWIYNKDTYHMLLDWGITNWQNSPTQEEREVWTAYLIELTTKRKKI